jgi:hypothetical protein
MARILNSLPFRLSQPTRPKPRITTLHHSVGGRIVVKVGLKNGRHVILYNHYHCHDTRPENNHT